MLLAIERSSVQGSAAVFDLKGKLRSSVTGENNAQGDAFALVQSALRIADAGLADITQFAVGIGPGSFSGIRSAIAVLNGLALPADAPVYGVNSALAAAHAYKTKHPDHTRPLLVVGDARRGRVWRMRVAEDSAAQHHTHDDFDLVEYARVAESLDRDALVITPDRHRLADILAQHIPAENLATEAVFPTAEAVARLALAGNHARALPIYLSPAVVG